MSDDKVKCVTRSLNILSLDEKDQAIMEYVITGDWSTVREKIIKCGADLSLKLVCCICSVNPPQSVIIAIKRTKSRIFAEKDEKDRYPLHYCCIYGAPTYTIVFAAQCYIAALEQQDEYRKTPLEYLMTMPWEYCTEDKDEVVEELQRCHNVKCYDEKSKLPNQVALETWGHKVVLEEKMNCFMVVFVECARFDKVPDWEKRLLSQIAEDIKEDNYNVVEAIRRNGKNVYIDVYRLVENQFVIVAKTQSKDDCEHVYQELCQKKIATIKREGLFLRLGCVYYEGIVGSATLSEIVNEAKDVQETVKDKLEKAVMAVTASIEDIKGERKVNVSELVESSLSKYSADAKTKALSPDRSMKKST